MTLLKKQKKTSASSAPRARPSHAGGTLIRQVIALLRQEANIQLPFEQCLTVAFSGGTDSLALAHLLIHYGHRVGKNIRLLHVNHQWRKEENKNEISQIRRWAKEWKVPLAVKKIPPPQSYLKGQSWEDEARKLRQTVFQESLKKNPGIILTAHHADDVAETVLWRFATGALKTHGAGILPVFSGQVRPFLRVRKKQIEAYLKEEQIIPLLDSSNHDTRFLRAQIRHKAMPLLEEVFPGMTQHLIDYAVAFKD